MTPPRACVEAVRKAVHLALPGLYPGLDDNESGTVVAAALSAFVAVEPSGAWVAKQSPRYPAAWMAWKAHGSVGYVFDSEREARAVANVLNYLEALRA